MRILLFSTISLLATLNLQAQPGFPARPLLFDPHDSLRFEAGVYGSYDAASNGIDNAFAGKLYFGGHIDSAMKAHTYGFLYAKNHAGINLETGAWFRWRCKNDSAGRHFVSLRNRMVGNGAFTSDVFQFAFSGNAPFKGDSIDFAGTNVNYYAWKQLQYGYEWNYTSKSNAQFRLTGAVSLLAGSDFAELDVTSGRLFTDTGTYNLDLKGAYTLRSSDTTHTGIGAFNGWGAGLDLGMKMNSAPGNSPLGDRMTFGLSITDLSFIAWNNKSRRYSQDTTLKFSGYTFDLNNLQDSTFNTLNIDSLSPGTGYDSYISKLPWTITLEGYSYYSLKNKSNTWFTGGGVRMRQRANASAELFFRQGFMRKNRLGITAEVGYGGYARLFAGIDVQADVYKGWWIHAGCRQLSAYVAPSQSTGQGAYVQLVKRF